MVKIKYSILILFFLFLGIVLLLFHTHIIPKKLGPIGKQHLNYSEEENYNELLLPIDSQNVQYEQKVAGDSSRWNLEDEKVKKEFCNLTLITQKEIDFILNEIKKWTDHYRIDLSQARYVKTDITYFNTPLDPDRTGIYHREYTDDNDSSSLIEMTYSPDKRRYIDLGIIYETVDGFHFDTGLYDDSQEVWYIDRKEKQQNIVFYNGVSERVNDIFWKDNDIFIAVGIELMYSALNKYVIYVFDINKQTRIKYELLTDINPYAEFTPYYEKFLKEKGIYLLR